MVAPVLAPNVTSLEVYLPEGAAWYSWEDGSALVGAKSARGLGSTTTVPAGLADPTPIFVRSGSIVPSQSPARTTALQAGNPLSLTLAIDPAGLSATGELWLDDGVSLQTQEQGLYLLVAYNASFAADGSSGTLKSAILMSGFAPPPGKTLLQSTRILGVNAWPTGNGASVNGAPASSDYVGGVLTINFATPLPLTTQLTLLWGSGVGLRL
jgi:hypothetical protein